jgi:hypothetical protein
MLLKGTKKGRKSLLFLFRLFITNSITLAQVREAEYTVSQIKYLYLQMNNRPKIGTGQQENQGRCFRALDDDIYRERE